MTFLGQRIWIVVTVYQVPFLRDCRTKCWEREREGGRETEREKQRELIILPSIHSCDTEDTCNSSEDSISRAFESQRSVIVVHIMCRWTVVFPAIGKWTVLAFKVIKTISFTVSVQATPFLYGITLGWGVRKRQSIKLETFGNSPKSRAFLVWIFSIF